MGINLVLLQSQALFTWECLLWFLSQTVSLCLPASAARAAGWCLGVNEQLSDAILGWVVQTLVPLRALLTAPILLLQHLLSHSR